MVIFIAVKGKEKIKSTLHIIFFFRGHGNKSCNLIGSLPSQYFPISAQEPW